MRKLFQYSFLNAHVVSTYRLVELSAQYKKNVPHRVLVAAACLILAAAKAGRPMPTFQILDPLLPGSFGRAIGKSQDIISTRNCYDTPVTRSAPPSAAWLKARQPGLAAIRNPSPRVVPTDDTLVDPQQQPAFHRYTLSGQGLDHSLTTPVRGLMNKLYNKGRTPRNKQIYRTGVF